MIKPITAPARRENLVIINCKKTAIKITGLKILANPSYADITLINLQNS